MDGTSATGGVTEILDNLVGSLPAVDLETEDSDEDLNSSDNGSECVSVFSRSQHLEMLGFQDTDESNVKQDHKGELNELLSQQEGHHMKTADESDLVFEATAEISENASVGATEQVEVDWNKFKEEFSATLQSSQEKLAEIEQPGELADDVSRKTVHEQLLINAIAMMHSSSSTVEQEGEETNSFAGSQSGFSFSVSGSSVTHKAGDLSPLRQRKRLLSQGTLETIHESEIDKVLEMADVDTKETHRSPPTEGPPLPKFVWDSEEKQDDGLMKELEQLSLSQSTKSSAVSQNDVSSSHGQGRTGFPGGQPPSNEEPTVFMDLRPSGPLSNSHVHGEMNGAHTLSSTAQRLLALRGGTSERSRSSSESEDGDDPYAWIAQRKQIKDTSQPVMSPRHNLHQIHKISKPQSPDIEHVHIQVKSDQYLASSRNTSDTNNAHKHSQTSNISVSAPIHSHIHGLATEDDTKTSTLSGKEESPSKSPGMLHVSSCSSLSEEEASVTVTLAKDIPPPAKMNGIEVHRQRSTDSLTLSSSFSENESPMLERLDHSKEKRTEMQANKSPKPAVSPTTSKKAQKRKLKKARKKEKAKEVNKHKRRSQRSRSDSLTTSSDEEHSSSGVEMISSTSTEKSTEDSGEVIIDEEALKLHLLKRIQSKKPPSHFATPATEPVFHEDVTFEPQCLCTDPTASTDAMLVLSLSEYGLATLQDVEFNLDLETRIALHLLVLTWLCYTAAFSDGHRVSHKNGEEVNKSVLRPPFLVTGLQLAILDGHPVILVGVAYRSKMKMEKESSLPTEHELRTKASFQHLENYIQATPLSSLLHEITSNDSIRKILSPSVFSQLSSFFQKPLASLFSLHDDPAPLTTPVSFYWHSGYHPSCLPTNESVKSGTVVATTVCTLGRTSLQNAELIFTVLHSIYYNGFDLAGLRLLYGEVDNYSDVLFTSALEQNNRKDLLSSITLALAIRGPDAVYRWIDIVGPKDTSLAKVTDPDSLNARFNSTTIDELHCLRTPYSAPAVLAKWFGGRACLKTGSLLGISDAHTKRERKKRQRVRFSESESDDTPPSPLPVDVTFPPLITNRPRLVTQAYSKLLLVVSPHIPPFLYSCVLASCSRLGFDVFGVKRIRLNSKRATSLHISGSFIFHFAPSSTPPSPAVIDSTSHPLSTDSLYNSPPLPSILLVVGRENALVHSVALKKEMLRNIAGMIETNPQLKAHYNLSFIMDCPESLLHVREYSEELVKVVGSFSTSLTVNSSQPKLAFGWDRDDSLQDELCFVAVPQSLSLSRALGDMDKVFRVNCESETEAVALHVLRSDSTREEAPGLCQFELLAFKIVPQLTRFYAKRLCPIPPDDNMYQHAVQVLSDGPATLMIFRGIGCNKRLLDILSQPPKSILHTGALEQRLQVIVSQDFQEAYSLSSIFFTDRELFCDTPNWALASFVPHSWLQDSDILQRMQRASPTLLISVLNISLLKLKLAMKVLDKLSRTGFKFVAMKLAEPLETESIELPVSSSVDDVRIVVCVQRENAVWHLQHILRPFNQISKGSPLFTCSGSFLEAISDTKQYFLDGLCCQPTSITKEYNINCETQDDFNELLFPAACRLATQPGLLGYVSPLLETTVMICPPCLIASETKLTTAGFIEVLDFLSQAKFAICGLKMVTLSEETGRALHHCCELLSTKVEDLTCGPSIVVVLQRDNAASCCQDIFRSTLQTCYHGNRADHVSKLLSAVVIPKTSKQAKEVQDLFKVSVSS